MPPKQFCPRNHDTHHYGRDKKGCCRECQRINRREWARRNPVKSRMMGLKERYGLLVDITINAVCGICGAKGVELVIDHDHTTNQIRGCLCQGCNKGIGFLKDDPELCRKAIAYLEKPNGR